MQNKYLLLSLLFLTACLGDQAFIGNQEIDFNAEVRPILQKNCLRCHGGIKQAGGFGLVFRENALKETDSGQFAIIPGNPKNSELINRITSTDPELRMPQEGAPLQQQEIDILKKWIAQGAQWADHWAYLPPTMPEVPDASSIMQSEADFVIPSEAEGWGNNEIDQFTFMKMLEHDLLPSPAADKKTLLRRVSLDLIGLPPTPEEVNAFTFDESPNAFEKAVDRLLASPRFGEHWASMWLDLARFADSKGYERDPLRQIWQYRDWVIKAFNEDKPFDEFSIEQLAGDLLPNPTYDQRIATAFHRNTMSNDEGGTHNEEYRIASVMDRVNTTMEVWQSTTMACVQCHSHPYDPIKHREYYEFFSFFNNTADFDHVREGPFLIKYKHEDEKQIHEIKDWIKSHGNESQLREFDDLVYLKEPKINATHFDDEYLAKFTNRADEDFMFVENRGHFRVKDVPLNGAENILLYYKRGQKDDAKVELRLGQPDGKLLGTALLPKTTWRLQMASIPIPKLEESVDLYFVFKAGHSEERVCDVLGILLPKPLPGKAKEGYQNIAAQFVSILNAEDSLRTPVMYENPLSLSRKTHLFERGNFLMKEEEVQSDVPKIWNDLPKGAPKNRLGMAQWLFAPDNPLTARVMVNRVWAQLFGTGIVETVEDFGTQGSLPSHPELLDWLSLNFANQDQWRLKALLKRIVLSATYQQSSKYTPQLLELDPKNKWLARGSRVRLSAEQIRDQALLVSGLLSDKMYGPSVMPPQPEGVWQTVYSGAKWTTSEGKDRYRRGIYTLIRRSAPYPSLITFDGSSREFCLSRRINTNTPLQALVTLNDPVYLEAAQALAKNINQLSGALDERLSETYEQLLLEPIRSNELEKLKQLYQESLAYYKEHPTEASEMTGEEAPLELAALTVVANAMLNLDEFIMKS